MPVQPPRIVQHPLDVTSVKASEQKLYNGIFYVLLASRQDPGADAPSTDPAQTEVVLPCHAQGTLPIECVFVLLFVVFFFYATLLQCSILIGYRL